VVPFYPAGHKCALKSVGDFLAKHPYKAADGTPLPAVWKRRQKDVKVGPGHEKEAQALHSYTVESPLYREINRAMRSGNEKALHGPKFRDQIDYIYHLKAALTIAEPTPAGMTFLYRGIRSKVHKEGYAPKAHLVWPSFSSTSSDLQVALTFAGDDARHPTGTLFIIQTPKKARGIKAFSEYPAEAEFLYVFNQRFVVAPTDAAESVVSQLHTLMQPLVDDFAGLDIIVLEES